MRARQAALPNLRRASLESDSNGSALRAQGPFVPKAQRAARADDWRAVASDDGPSVRRGAERSRRT
eukprot:2069185-Alexandrium_andersonii.AAC.1